MRLLVPDTWHFHRRNFLPLFRWIRQSGAALRVDRSRRRWWKRHGDYRGLAQRLDRHVAALSRLSADELLARRHHDIPVFACARSELLCLLLPRPHWIAGGSANDEEAVLRRAFVHAEDRTDLLLCMAAAENWIDHWRGLLAGDPAITHALVFSGSYIYARTLQQVGTRAGLRLFCLETFFTGNEFYFEERGTPLPNRSLLADPSWYARLALPDDVAIRARLRAEAHRRLAAMRSRNVPAPRRMPVLPPAAIDTQTLLVVGQVLNDFSLIETPLPEASSIATYRELIEGVLDRTGFDVVFKAHPWERRRPRIGRPLTLETLSAWRDGLPERWRSRLRLAEQEPLATLLPRASHVVSLCSQGLLEACEAGLKPCQIGSAFFGNKGFTSDFDGAGAFVDALACGAVRGTLDLAEYRLFEDFLVRALLLHLVPNAAEGATTIGERLTHRSHVPDATGIVRALPADEPTEDPGLLVWIAEIVRNPRPWLHMLKRRRGAS